LAEPLDVVVGEVIMTVSASRCVSLNKESQPENPINKTARIRNDGLNIITIIY
jgi:hypothetical protein